MSAKDGYPRRGGDKSKVESYDFCKAMQYIGQRALKEEKIYMSKKKKKCKPCITNSCPMSSLPQERRCFLFARPPWMGERT